MTFMSKTAATKIARHLYSAVHKVAASGNSVTWGYNYASGPKTYSTASFSSYAEALAYRKQSIADLIDELVNGVDDYYAANDAPKIPAPEWMTEFRW